MRGRSAASSSAGRGGPPTDQTRGGRTHDDDPVFRVYDYPNCFKIHMSCRSMKEALTNPQQRNDPAQS